MRRYPAFVINLRERTTRLDAFARRARSAGLSCERIDAVDTRDLAKLSARADAIDGEAHARLLETVRRGHRLSHADLTPGAIGCALSHVEVSRRALRRRLPCALVFEDDAWLWAGGAEWMSGIITRAAPGWDCLLFGWNGAPTMSGGAELQRVVRFTGMHAYALSESGMAAMVELNTPVRTHVDQALSEAAARGQVTIFGVNRQEDRIQQQAKGSDVQQGYVVKTLGTT